MRLEPTYTLMDMLLTEPGSRIDGPTEDVLRVIYSTIFYSMQEAGADEETADAAAIKLMGRLHEALRSHGYVVRDLGADR